MTVENVCRITGVLLRVLNSTQCCRGTIVAIKSAARLLSEWASASPAKCPDFQRVQPLSGYSFAYGLN